jgi:hypothetical protein
MELNIGIVVVSNRILLDKKDPRWMYRESTTREGDSGWRVFAGDEDDEYLKNPQNIKFLSADQLIAIDDSLKVNLLAPVGFSFEKNVETNRWEIVDGE